MSGSGCQKWLCFQNPRPRKPYPVQPLYLLRHLSQHDLLGQPRASCHLGQAWRQILRVLSGCGYRNLLCLYISRSPRRYLLNPRLYQSPCPSLSLPLGQPRSSCRKCPAWRQRYPNLLLKSGSGCQRWLCLQTIRSPRRYPIHPRRCHSHSRSLSLPPRRPRASCRKWPVWR